MYDFPGSLPRGLRFGHLGNDSNEPPGLQVPYESVSLEKANLVISQLPWKIGEKWAHGPLMDLDALHTYEADVLHMGSWPTSSADYFQQILSDLGLDNEYPLEVESHGNGDAAVRWLLNGPHLYMPSTTEGHGHLYLDRALSEEIMWLLMDALVEVDMVEPNYVLASKNRGYTALRLPWVKKVPIGDDEDDFDDFDDEDLFDDFYDSDVNGDPWKEMTQKPSPLILNFEGTPVKATPEMLAQHKKKWYDPDGPAPSWMSKQPVTTTVTFNFEDFSKSTAEIVTGFKDLTKASQKAEKVLKSWQASDEQLANLSKALKAKDWTLPPATKETPAKPAVQKNSIPVQDEVWKVEPAQPWDSTSAKQIIADILKFKQSQIEANNVHPEPPPPPTDVVLPKLPEKPVQPKNVTVAFTNAQTADALVTKMVTQAQQYYWHQIGTNVANAFKFTNPS